MPKNKTNIKTSIKIQLYPYLDSVHTAYKSLISDPPKGYVFIGSTNSVKKRFVDKIKQSEIIRGFYKTFISIFKTTRFTESAHREKEMPEASFVYSFGTFYKGDKPFIVDILDSHHSFSGNSHELFLKHKSDIEEYLSRKNCIKIICPHETVLNFMRNNFNKTVQKKLVLIRQALKPIPYKINEEKFKKNHKVRILFMGSINNPRDFYMKGGLEAIQVFKEISKYYNTELILRCKIPEKIRNFIKNIPQVTLFDDSIPFEKVIQLYSSSDILLMPNHQFSLMATLESLYFGLPIVTLDTYAVRDFVKDNYNGFIVRPSKKLTDFYNSKNYPPIIRSRKFIDALWNFDSELIKRLAEKVQILIDNPALRKKMGENGKKTIQKNFSVEVRNAKLKKIFDDIVNGKI